MRPFKKFFRLRRPICRAAEAENVFFLINNSKKVTFYLVDYNKNATFVLSKDTKSSFFYEDI